MTEENQSLSLYDKFQSVGIWFLPESKERKLSGTMEYDNNGISLTTIGSFAATDADVFSIIKKFEEGPEEKPIILGLTTDDRIITLVDCAQTGLHTASNGIVTCKFRAMSMFVGKHFDTLEEIEFKSVSVDWSNLHLWVAQSSFKTDRSESIDKKIKLEYQQPPSIKAKIDEEFELEIVHGASTGFSIYSEERKITQTTSLMIKSQTPHKLKDFWDIQTCFRHFLMLSMMKNVYPISIRAKTADQDNTSVSVFPSIRLHDYVPERSLSRDMLFHYPLLSQNFQSYVQTWRKFWIVCRDLLIDYFTTLLDEGSITLEIKFQRVVQVLEAYHRKKFPSDKKMSDEDYEKMIQNMKSKCVGAQNQINYIKQFKSMGNWPNLAERLQKLVDMCPDAFNDAAKEKHDFTVNVSKTRHYNAHGLEFSDGVITDTQQLVYLTHQMMALAEACFLSELPFSSDNLKEFIIKIRHVRNFARDHDTARTSSI
ncbi:MAG: HEPN domain-containing protein [Nitrosotalea sp.]